jgi:parallel beta-helix repeat protein
MRIFRTPPKRSAPLQPWREIIGTEASAGAGETAAPGGDEPPAPGPRRRVRVLLWGCALITAVITVLAYWPVPEDPRIPVSEQGGGARQGESSVGGLQIPFPAPPVVDGEQAALGRLLFYDPVLSADNTRACASCHHPDQGFSDGRAQAESAHGAALRRNSPTLWNVAYVEDLFWDGRAGTLETQMRVPLLHADEMGADLDGTLEELRAIPEYAALFAAAFPASAGVGASPITADTLTAAIAAFERTLISRDAAFDRYAAGDFDALTPSQRRGFEVFRSAETRCFECHAWPLFTHGTFHVLGVPDAPGGQPDLGRLEAVQAPDAAHAFRTPTLRNIALTAPYMHNGVFATLEAVVEFYAEGGGAAFGVPYPIDEKVAGFTITEQETRDLVAFLHALTSEPAALVAIPSRVPSGLPVVSPLEPARASLLPVASAPPPADPRPPTTWTVRPGERIQHAADQARAGDVVEVWPGVYHETVYIDHPGITVRGVMIDTDGDGDTDGDSERPWIDGRGVLSDGFNTTGDDLTLEGFGIRDTVGNGILTTGAERVAYRDLIIRDAGIYGVYPVECTGVLIERVEATGIADAAIYVGQSHGPIVVRDNIVYGNVTGIEIENSIDAEVYGNHVYDNTGGILVFLLPNNPSRVGYRTRVYDNLVEHNNHPNFAAENAIVGKVPPGTGIMILSADETEVFHNTIRGNQTGGIGVTSLYWIYPPDTVFDLGPLPEHNWIHDNVYENNGYDPQGEVAALGIPGADIMWTGDGWSNAFDDPTATSFPPVLPSRSMPVPLRRALWRFYDLIIQAAL